MVEATDPALETRVAALRRLAAKDVVPAIHEIVKLCAAGSEVSISRKVAGPGRLVGYTKDVCLKLQPSTEHPTNVSEAVVVFAATAASMPAAAWRGKPIVELGCGVGFTGILLAALGARVVLADEPTLDIVVMNNIAMNAPTIRAPGSASFAPLDWAEPRGSEVSSSLRDAGIVIFSDVVVDFASQERFLAVLQALLGMDGEPPICRSLERVLVSHKHQQSFCISGYVAPTVDAKPSITDVGMCERCSFRQSLFDAGFQLAPWHPAPINYEHPFVECWSVRPRPSSDES